MTKFDSTAELFVRGNDRLSGELADPDTAAQRVDEIRAGMDAADQEYLNHLATIRKAAHLVTRFGGRPSRDVRRFAAARQDRAA